MTDKPEDWEDGDGLTNDGRPYDVGYGKPPVSTRFRPGQSGNPKGRSTGSRSFGQIVRDAVNEKVTVRTARGERKMSKIEAIVHTNTNKAMQGDPKATDRLIKILQVCGIAVPSPADVDQHSSGRLSAEDEAILARMLDQPPAP